MNRIVAKLCLEAHISQNYIVFNQHDSMVYIAYRLLGVIYMDSTDDQRG